MSKKRDYYQVLGVQKTATTDQIKKAYKKLAVKWHPDKNLNNKQQAKAKFTQINEAYQILSDQNKRKQYDTYGFDGPKFQGFGGGGFGSFHFRDANDIFKQFFSSNGFDDDNDNDFFSSFFGRGKNGKKSSGPFGNFGSFGGMGGFHSAFNDDDFFKGGFGGGGFSSFSSSTVNGGPGISKSTSTTTKTVNGKTVTTKKTTIIKPDGSKEITQEVIDSNGISKVQKNTIGPGETQKKSVKY